MSELEQALMQTKFEINQIYVLAVAAEKSVNEGDANSAFCFCHIISEYADAFLDFLNGIM